MLRRIVLIMPLLQPSFLGTFFLLPIYITPVLKDSFVSIPNALSGRLNLFKQHFHFYQKFRQKDLNIVLLCDKLKSPSNY